MKLLVIEDHPFVRACLRFMTQQLYPTCEIIEADNAEQGLFLAVNEPVDLIVLDLCLPSTKGGKERFGQGFAILDALQISAHTPPIIVMSARRREAPAILARQRGVAAFLGKGAQPAELWDAMDRCLRGRERAPADRATLSATVPDQTPPLLTPADLDISQRMFDVLQLALRGCSSKKIAQILGINGSNVRHYLSRLYAKFGVANINALQAHFALSGRVMSIVLPPGEGANPSARRILATAAEA